MALVELHAVARCKQDEYPLRAGLFEQDVHSRRKLPFPLDRVLAVVQVPHVAHDDGGLARIPILLRGDDSEIARAFLRFDALLEG